MINLGYHINPKYSHPSLLTLYFSSTFSVYSLITNGILICVELNSPVNPVGSVEHDQIT